MFLKKSILTVNEVKVMHIPPKPFRDKEMKMSTERAVRKQKEHNWGTTAELQEGLGLAQSIARHRL